MTEEITGNLNCININLTRKIICEMEKLLIGITDT